MLKRVVPVERVVRFEADAGLRAGLSCKIDAIESNYYADLA